ncbi:MAG: NUDIX hydrolase [Bacteroidota bacterium]
MGKGKVSLRVRLILEDSGKILLLKQTKYNGGAYTLVGGKVEVGETAKQTLVRESWEEAGIILKEGDLELVHTLNYFKESSSRLVLFFKAQHWSGKLTSRERHKFKELEWHRCANLPRQTKLNITKVLQRMRQGFTYTEIR